MAVELYDVLLYALGSSSSSSSGSSAEEDQNRSLQPLKQVKREKAPPEFISRNKRPFRRRAAPLSFGNERQEEEERACSQGEQERHRGEPHKEGEAADARSERDNGSTSWVLAVADVDTPRGREEKVCRLGKRHYLACEKSYQAHSWKRRNSSGWQFEREFRR